MKPNRFKRSIEFAFEQHTFIYVPSYLVELGGLFPLSSGDAENGLLRHHVLAAAIACVSLGSVWSSPAGRMKWVTWAVAAVLVLVGYWLLWAEGRVYLTAVYFLSFWLGIITP